MTNFNFSTSHSIDHAESIRINRRNKTLTGFINGYSYVDKSTKQYVCYMPSLEISGYGETLEKAKEMLRFCLKEMCAYLVSLSDEQLSRELDKLGWRRNSLFKKEYSKVHVDDSDALRDIDADGEVERFSAAA